MKNIAKLTPFIVLLSLFTSCVSTKSTLKNVDDNAPIPGLKDNNTFYLSEYAKDRKYGYDADYPVNVFYQNAKDEKSECRTFSKCSGWAKWRKNNLLQSRKLLPISNQKN